MPETIVSGSDYPHENMEPFANREPIADSEKMQVDSGAVHSAVGYARILVQDIPRRSKI